jgi:acid phosphatase (class A)
MSDNRQERSRMRSRRPRPSPSAGLGSLIAVFAFGAMIGVVGGLMFAPRPPAPFTATGAGGSTGLARPADALAAASGDPADPNAAGYLPPAAMLAANFLPAPPAEGPRTEADRRVFETTRALKDTPRWALAQNDVDQTPAATLKDFSCAVGAQLSSAAAPFTFNLLERFAHDQTAILEPAKSTFHRPRPFLSNKGDICVARTDELVNSPDYPSGHGAWGWAVALILAQAVPERADQILARGRAFGESRVVCGVHTPEAVQAGQMMGSAIVAAAQGQAAFRNDLESAASELATLRRSAATASAPCQAEAALIAKPAY